MKDKNNKGFTLMELLVVMIILGLLAAFVAPRVYKWVGPSKQKAAKIQISLFESALEKFLLDMDRYPTTEEGLNALVKKPAGAEKWAGPYLKKEIPLDPWGHPYVYKSPGEHGDYDIISYGKDGQPGGEGEDRDIVSWK
ncbi:MAG: type II secretion system protein GspG [Spirochaetes bacterium]|nr:type II secretion system major pseudopilin GspG [Deltaproteobacteria bacterium]RKY01194.1 MAG: type II secretion system protein GspG [Spirochaetota bacterium]RLA88377.1 MAG: type II secretion system protein GspG [Deltaproteobacteria bacterium]